MYLLNLVVLNLGTRVPGYAVPVRSLFSARHRIAPAGRRNTSSHGHSMAAAAPRAAGLRRARMSTEPRWVCAQPGEQPAGRRLSAKFSHPTQYWPRIVQQRAGPRAAALSPPCPRPPSTNASRTVSGRQHVRLLAPVSRCAHAGGCVAAAAGRWSWLLSPWPYVCALRCWTWGTRQLCLQS
eukprot:SAG31_NODE_21397_length_550_cov_1.645233_1_plen_180_part_01